MNSHSQDYVDICEVYLSGSNSKMLSSELATLLSGRYVEFMILPFLYQEYLEMRKEEKGKKSYRNYLDFG